MGNEASGIMICVQLQDRDRQEKADAERCRQRLQCLNDAGMPAKDHILDWNRQRLPRILADHLLRSGHAETASLLTKTAHLEVDDPPTSLICTKLLQILPSFQASVSFLIKSTRFNINNSPAHGSRRYDECLCHRRASTQRMCLRML